MSDPIIRNTDTTLESNWFTAYVPRFPLLDRLTHLAQSFWSYAKSCFNWLCGSSPVSGALQDLRPRGDERVYLADLVRYLDESDILSQAQIVKLPSNESFDNLPALHSSELIHAQKYNELCLLAFAQHAKEMLPVYRPLGDAQRARNIGEPDISIQVQDAFDYLTTNKKSLLPDTVLKSTLRNQGCPHDDFNNRPPRDDEGLGLQDGNDNTIPYMNVLTDRATTFGAMISYDKPNKELIVSFTPAFGMDFSGWGSGGRAFLHWLGFVPKPFSQASKLVQLIKAHLEANKADFEGVKLTLSGFCYGGALAEYAALRNRVPAVVFNPVHLGNGVRARIGQARLDEAHKFVTEIVVQNDIAADSAWAWLYHPLRLIGMRSTGPVGTANRIIVPMMRESANDLSRPDAQYAHDITVPHLKYWGEIAKGMERLKKYLPWLTANELQLIIKRRPIEEVIKNSIEGRLKVTAKNKESINSFAEAVASFASELASPQPILSSLEEKLNSVQNHFKKITEDPAGHGQPGKYIEDLAFTAQSGRALRCDEELITEPNYAVHLEEHMPWLNTRFTEPFTGMDIMHEQFKEEIFKKFNVIYEEDELCGLSCELATCALLLNSHYNKSITMILAGEIDFIRNYVEHLTDEQIKRLPLGVHDSLKKLIESYDDEFSNFKKMYSDYKQPDYLDGMASEVEKKSDSGIDVRKSIASQLDGHAYAFSFHRYLPWFTPLDNVKFYKGEYTKEDFSKDIGHSFENILENEKYRKFIEDLSALALNLYMNKYDNLNTIISTQIGALDEDIEFMGENASNILSKKVYDGLMGLIEIAREGKGIFIAKAFEVGRWPSRKDEEDLAAAGRMPSRKDEEDLGEAGLMPLRKDEEDLGEAGSYEEDLGEAGSYEYDPTEGSGEDEEVPRN